MKASKTEVTLSLLWKGYSDKGVGKNKTMVLLLYRSVAGQSEPVSTCRKQAQRSLKLSAATWRS